MTKEEERDFIDKWEKEYFSCAESGIIKNKTEKSFEEEIERILEKETEYTKEEIATFMGWKMGYPSRISILEAKKNDKWNNGYGKRIDGLNGYIDYVYANQFEIRSCLEAYSRDGVKNALGILVASGSVPSNIGTVSIINIMYFISRREIPIYDKYAHIALEALLFNKMPWEIRVDNPPSKEQTDAIGDLMDKYVDCLKQLFGSHKITRNLERALWVYGHLKKADYEKVMGTCDAD